MEKHYMKNTDAAAVQNKIKQKQERLVDDALQIKAPRSFVISQGAIISKLRKLVKDVRKVMEPFTASSLQEKKGNSLKDFLSMASFFHVTHLIAFSETALDTPYMRVCRLPQGPTLSFKIHSYSLTKDIGRMYRKNVSVVKEYQTPPLVILNGFTKEPHSQLMTTMFQNMFPTISVKTLKLSHCKRVVMFNYNKETKMVEMRHYLIMVNNAGVNRAVRKLSKSTKLFVLSGGAGAVSSDSEMDETGIPTVTPQNMSKSVAENSLVNVRLREIGPRIDLELVKIQDGFFDGKTIFHAYSIRTPQEEAHIAIRKQQEKSLKERRRTEQEENVRKKLARKGKQVTDKKIANKMEDSIADIPEMDDLDYYRQEVGEEPDEDFILSTNKKKGKSMKITTSATPSAGTDSSKKNKRSADDGPKRKKVNTDDGPKKKKVNTDDGPKRKKVKS